MTQYNANPGYAFPLEKLGSDLSRNQYNYESIFNTLVNWNKTTEPEVRCKLSIDTAPWFQDYVIPSKYAIEGSNEFTCSITGMTIAPNGFGIEKDVNTPARGCEIQQPAYGGERSILKSVIESYVIGVDTISLDTTGFKLNDYVKFDKAEPNAILDSGLFYNKKYKIINITPTLMQIQSDAAIVWGNNASGLIYCSKYVTSEPMVDKTNEGDVVTVRAAIENSGNGLYEIWTAPDAQNWVLNGTYTYGNYVYHNNILYQLLGNVYFSTLSPNLDQLNFKQVFTDWVSGFEYKANQFVIDELGDLYKSLKNITSNIKPSLDEVNWVLYASHWVGNGYHSGSYVFDTTDRNLYVSIKDIAPSTLIPSALPSSWKRVFFIKFPTTPTASTSFSASWRTWLNLSEYVLRNVSKTQYSINANIKLSATTRGMNPPSIYQRTTGMYPTSNFSFWPNNNTPAWQLNQNYVTDPLISVNSRQNYTATMVFDHTRTDSVSTINWINYDGPDLDQGLAIYLPVLVETGPNTFNEPEDGFTYEFFFRIWPNAAYTNAVTRDHIINKAQIYVYSAGTYDEVSDAKCSNVIAKFSMARLTNFYMFGENVSIPDKPVCYKATFGYNSRTKQWMTTDYYQLPDHQFIGPIGYIDPQNPSNQDINSDLIGDIGPNPAFIGYETAAFPLFQDPFSNESLEPIRPSSPETFQRFINRIL